MSTKPKDQMGVATDPVVHESTVHARDQIEPEPISVVTKDTGGRAKPVGALEVSPEQQLGADEAAAFAPGSGLDGAAFGDILSGFLAHERDGVHLYRVVAAATTVDEHRDRFEQFGAETAEHIRIYEQLIVDLGGDPMYVSPPARLRCAQNGKLLETLLLAGSADVDTYEQTLVDAVVVAETACQGNWRFLQQLVGQLAESPTRDSIEEAVDAALEQEDGHLEWALTTRDALLRALALPV